MFSFTYFENDSVLFQQNDQLIISTLDGKRWLISKPLTCAGNVV